MAGDVAKGKVLVQKKGLSEVMIETWRYLEVSLVPNSVNAMLGGWTLGAYGDFVGQLLAWRE